MNTTAKLGALVLTLAVVWAFGPSRPARIEAEQLTNRVEAIYSRAIIACNSIAPSSKCDQIIKTQSYLNDQIQKARYDYTGESFRSLSQRINSLETESAPALRDMEASAEAIKDFPRRIMDLCKRLPVGDPNRPKEAICDMPD
jgi:hypothetical protein